LRRWIVPVVSILAVACAGSAWSAPAKSRALVVKPGYDRLLTRAQLGAGAEIRCVDQGHVLSVRVPESPWTGNGALWARTGSRRFHLNVDVEPGRGYVVRCGLGGVYWAHPVTR
jgi:hypothetical protein